MVCAAIVALIEYAAVACCAAGAEPTSCERVCGSGCGLRRPENDRETCGGSAARRAGRDWLCGRQRRCVARPEPQRISAVVWPSSRRRSPSCRLAKYLWPGDGGGDAVLLAGLARGQARDFACTEAGRDAGRDCGELSGRFHRSAAAARDEAIEVIDFGASRIRRRPF